MPKIGETFHKAERASRPGDRNGTVRPMSVLAAAGQPGGRAAVVIGGRGFGERDFACEKAIRSRQNRVPQQAANPPRENTAASPQTSGSEPEHPARNTQGEHSTRLHSRHWTANPHRPRLPGRFLPDPPYIGQCESPINHYRPQELLSDADKPATPSPMQRQGLRQQVFHSV